MELPDYKHAARVAIVIYILIYLSLICQLCAPLQIQGQQFLQNHFIAQIGLPPIRRKNSLVQPLVRQIQLGAALVLFQLPCLSFF
jgi:hypothetical protein